MSDSLEDTIKSAVDDLKDWMHDNPFSKDPGDAISEIADSSTPIYNYDILSMALDDTNLALREPDVGPAFDGSPTPINIIAANIYEAIEAALWEYYNEHEDLRECDRCEEEYSKGELTTDDEFEFLCWDCYDELHPEEEEEEEEEDGTD